MMQGFAVIGLAVACLVLAIACVWLAARIKRLNKSMEFQFRQHAERHLKRDQSIQELMRRLDTYMGVCVKMGEELQALQQLAAPLPERLSKLEQSDPTMISYIQASRLVTLGASVEDLTQSCGLTKGEAELVSKLYKARAAKQEAE